ncbi:MAG: Hsp20/alpha crystallin family protein [Candidatus Hinthialibacter sp.]
MAEKTVPTQQESQVVKSTEKTRSEARYVAPPVDIYEENDRLIVAADLPGAEKDSISVDVKDGLLTLQAAANPYTVGNPIYTEFEYINYYRQFELSEAVDVDKISADYKHGVLLLTLPKSERAITKKIEVNVAS